MVRSFLLRAVGGIAFAGLSVSLSANARIASADEPVKNDKSADQKAYDGKPVEFFKAIEDKQIEAILIPRDDKAMVLQVINKTDHALAVQAPRVFAGVLVLEQFLPAPANPNPKVIGKQDKAPQKLVGAFNQNGQNNPFNNAFNVNGPNNRPNGPNANPLFNIPPEKTLRYTVACVCIEHGKPEPSPHYPYEIRSVESVTDGPQIREVVDSLGSGKCSQRVAQIAAWHFSDNMSWDQLTDLTIKHLNGAKAPWFTKDEIAQAKQLVAELPSSQTPKGDKTASTAR